jgi:hypothetical protein
MADDVEIVVCGATGQDLIRVIADENNDPINISTATVRLQCRSGDIVKTLDVAGAILDGPAGKATWVGIGNETTFIHQVNDLGALPFATFTCQVKVTLAGEVLFSPEFLVRWTARVQA